MSLIIDALKRAQQPRLTGEEESQVFKIPSPNMKGRKGSKRRWILIGMSLIGFCIVIMLILKPSSSNLTGRPHQAAVSTQEKPALFVANAMASEPPPQVLDMPETKNSTPANRLKTEGRPDHKVFPGKTALSSQEKKMAMKKDVSHEEKEETPVKQTPAAEKMNPQRRIVEKEIFPSPLPAAHQAGASSRTMGVKQEGEKDRLLISEILTQFNMGVTYYNQNEFLKAIQAYRKVIEMDPDYIEAYNNLGVTYQRIGNMEKAFEAYQKSTEINPLYEKGYNNLGILLLLKGRYDEAMEAFQKALAVNSNNIETYLRIGVLYKKKGEGEKAVESYQKALSIDPLRPETHYHIALVYEQMGKPELAVHHYRQFLGYASKSQPELAAKVEKHLSALMDVKQGK